MAGAWEANYSYKYSLYMYVYNKLLLIYPNKYPQMPRTREVEIS